MLRKKSKKNQKNKSNNNKKTIKTVQNERLCKCAHDTSPQQCQIKKLHECRGQCMA